MKNLVVREIQAVDQVAYDSLESKPEIGDSFEQSNSAQEGWVGGSPFKMRLVDESSDEFRAIPREFRLWWEAPLGKFFYESFDSEFESHMRSGWLLDKEYAKVVTSGAHTLAPGELRKGWVLKEYNSFDELTADYPDFKEAHI